MNNFLSQSAASPPQILDADGTVDRLVIPVIEEVATVSRRLVETGHAVRVRKLVHEDEVNVDGSSTVDHADVERVAVGRVLDGPVGVRHEGDVMIVPVVEERLVTVKQLVLVEEIRITRITRSSRVQPATVPVTLRREEVVVERFDPETGQWLETPANAGEPPTGR